MIVIDAAQSKSVALARSSLAEARVDLDDAVRSLSGPSGETVMASANVVDLLFRVVTARQYLEKLESLPTLGSPS